jgi:glycosyltransferase involved in cell wall biosynthesis
MIKDKFPTIGSDSELPRLAIVVPCLDEKKYIKSVITDALEGAYPPDRVELYIVDGMSTDGTREIVKDIMKKYPQLRLLDNPGASKPRALNLAIRSTDAEVVMRLDAHARYPKDYIISLVRALYEFDADNVGGVRKNIPRDGGIWARSFAEVLTHPFGVGDARHYTGVSEPVESDIVFLFCVRRQLFEEVGFFDERLTRGQDREFNLRLSRLGKRMILVPNVECLYFVRGTLSTFVPWAFESGATPLRISGITGSNLISLRSFIPVAFVLWCAVFFVMGIFTPYALLLLVAGLFAYFVFAFAVSASMALKKRRIAYLVSLPLVFFLWHFAYGLGFLKELFSLTSKDLGRRS